MNEAGTWATDQPWDHKSIWRGFDATLATARNKSNSLSLNNII